MNESWGSSGQVVERSTKPAALADFSSEDEHPGSNSMSDFEDGNLPAPPSIDSSPTEEDYEKYDQEVAKYEDNAHVNTQNEETSQSASNEIEQELAKVLAEAKIASVVDAEKARAQIKKESVRTSQNYFETIKFRIFAIILTRENKR